MSSRKDLGLLEYTRTEDGFVMGEFTKTICKDGPSYGGDSYVLFPNDKRLDVIWQWCEPYRPFFVENGAEGKTSILLPPVQSLDAPDVQITECDASDDEEEQEASNPLFDEKHPRVGTIEYRVRDPIKTEGDVLEMFRIMLPFYRRVYDMTIRQNVTTLTCDDMNAEFYGLFVRELIKALNANRIED